MCISPFISTPTVSSNWLCTKADVRIPPSQSWDFIPRRGSLFAPNAVKPPLSENNVLVNDAVRFLRGQYSRNASLYGQNIARAWGRNMGYLVWLQSLVYCLSSSRHSFIVLNIVCISPSYYGTWIYTVYSIRFLLWLYYDFFEDFCGVLISIPQDSFTDTRLIIYDYPSANEELLKDMNKSGIPSGHMTW